MVSTAFGLLFFGFILNDFTLPQGEMIIIMVYLDTAYFAEIENFLLKILQIKVKVSWNSTVGHMNNVKKCSETHK